MNMDREDAEMLKLTMKALKEFYGLNPGKQAASVRETGNKLGLVFADGFVDGDSEEVIEQMAEFWVKNGIGEMRWDKETGLLKIDNCSDCLGRSYGAGYTLCPFKEGFIGAVLSKKTGQQVVVSETECCGTLADGCRFKVVHKR